MEKGLEARKRIVETAQEMFYRDGYSKVAVNDIVDQLGMSKKTIYKYFSSKEELLKSIVEADIRDLDVRVSTIVDDQVIAFEEKLHRVMDMVRAHLNRIGPHCLRDLKKYTPRVYSMLENFRKQSIMHHFMSILQEGIEKKVFRSDIDPKMVVMMYVHIIQNMINPETLANVSYSAEELYKMILKTFLGGILTDKARAQILAFVEENRT